MKIEHFFSVALRADEEIRVVRVFAGGVTQCNKRCVSTRVSLIVMTSRAWPALFLLSIDLAALHVSALH